MKIDQEKGLEALRNTIDAIDAEIVVLLAKRLRVVDDVVAIKKASGLPATIPERVERVVGHVRRKAEMVGCPPDLAEKLWRLLIDETIAYEDQRLK